MECIHSEIELEIYMCLSTIVIFISFYIFFLLLFVVFSTINYVCFYYFLFRIYYWLFFFLSFNILVFIFAILVSNVCWYKALHVNFFLFSHELTSLYSSDANKGQRDFHYQSPRPNQEVEQPEPLGSNATERSTYCTLIVRAIYFKLCSHCGKEMMTNEHYFSLSCSVFSYQTSRIILYSSD